MMLTKQWDHKLDVSDVFHNDQMTFVERRDAIVKRIKKAPFFDKKDDSHLTYIVDGLSYADNVDEFDGWWSEFYDWADAGKRVWVVTDRCFADKP